MLITVMFGAGCRELLNPWCSLVTLTAHLRQRGQVPQDASIALLSEDGHLVSLEEGASQAPPMGSTLLQERGTYVLVQIISKVSWAFQRSYAGCLAYPRRVMAGGDAQAHGVATRSKVLLQGPERWAPYHQGPTSWDQEPVYLRCSIPPWATFIHLPSPAHLPSVVTPADKPA
nr:uncharacterized protein C22orf15 homolog isoform X3 [Manis javanica]XP_036849459.1 uncharacterized protein C22orf15 homolog isoform X3 [Manis javanica]XP_036849460.1 uncharacterized protein C22orf15 homolog isoform X3 [Manis javanica]